MGIYFSSLDGNKIDNVIQILKEMHPQIVVTDAQVGAEVSCTNSTISYSETLQADEDGMCTFNIPEYGTYMINGTIEQPMYAFKRAEVSLI